MTPLPHRKSDFPDLGEPMKKKTLLILSAVGLILLLIFVIFAVVMANRGFAISKGIYLESKSDHPLIVMGNSPVSMSDQTDGNLFEGLQTGDRILVLHDGIAETYPGSTGVYAVWKIGSGAQGDIPSDVIRSLIEMGWIDGES